MTSNKTITLLSWFNSVVNFIPMGPVIILFFAHVSGSYVLAGSIYMILQVSSSLFELPTGVLSDRWGRQRVMFAGTVAALIGAVLYALGFGYLSLVLGAVFMGLSQALYSGNNDALLYEVMVQSGAKEEYGEVYGKINGRVQIAMGISAVLGGFLAKYSFSLLAWVCVLPFLLSLIICLFIPNSQNDEGEKGNSHGHLKEAIHLFITNKRLRLFSLFSIISGGLGESSYSFLPAFYATVVPVWSLGIINALNKVIVYVSFHFAGRIVKKLGEVRTLFLDFWFDRVVSIFAFVFPSVLSPFLIAFSGLLFGPYLVAQSTLFQEEFTDKHRATMGSLNSLGGSIFYGLMAIVLGVLADHISPGKSLVLFQLLIIPTVFLLRGSLRHKKTLA